MTAGKRRQAGSLHDNFLALVAAFRRKKTTGGKNETDGVRNVLENCGKGNPETRSLIVFGGRRLHAGFARAVPKRGGQIQRLVNELAQVADFEGFFKIKGGAARFNLLAEIV